MTKLSVNINKLATLRNARGHNNPDLLEATEALIRFGAQGITVHPRPDERHIRKQDVLDLSQLLKGRKLADGSALEFNIEGFPDQTYMTLVESTLPAQATLVPDPPEAITSNAGWRVHERFLELKPVLEKLRDLGVRSSIFIDPMDMDEVAFDALEKLKPDRIELYTENFARTQGTNKGKDVLSLYKLVGEEALVRKIDLNAGHDLDSTNLGTLVDALPKLKEVSIGHALVCDALYWGFEKTIQVYLDAIRSRRPIPGPLK
jgi:pyridoxine 5-phosphate synthase